MRESLWAFPAALIVHAVGMALLAGIGAAVGLRALGMARDAPAHLFGLFAPVMWLGFWLALVSGLALLAAYPAKALTNPVFGVKFMLLAGAMLLVRLLLRPGGSATTPRIIVITAASACLALWAAAIAAGRLLAYTHTVLMVS